MILVLKINGFLRSIDKRIGNPLNNISIMVIILFIYFYYFYFYFYFNININIFLDGAFI